MERRGFLVSDASLQDGVVDLLAKEHYDVMLVVAPEDVTAARDLVQACRDVRPSLHVYLIAADGDLALLIPGIQPAFGKKVPINDLPGQLLSQVARADIDRDHFRLEWLGYAEGVLDEVGSPQPIREAAHNVAEKLQAILQCSGSAVLLRKDPSKPPETASAGNADAIINACKPGTPIYEWLAENLSPLDARRGRATIPGIQREVIRFDLGPSAFAPIIAGNRLAGVVMAGRHVNQSPFAESALIVLRMTAKAFSLRLSQEQSGAADQLQEVVQHERAWRQSLEDAVAEGRAVLRRLAREVASMADARPDRGPERSETVSRLTAALAEQLEFKSEHIPEAVYLRNIGALAQADAMAKGGAAERARLSFEILSRVRMPSPCLEVARHHYENYDGSGVPDGLKGEEIPFLARVVRVVEDYVDMANLDRMADAVRARDAIVTLMRESGKAYDPRVADALVKLAQTKGITPEQETLSLIAHELRNPLTFLAGFSELLAARGDLPDQVKEIATELHKQTEHMVNLTERLLELSRLQSGQVSLTKQWVDLVELARDQVTKTGALSDRHTFRVLASPDPVRVRADITRVAQAMSNLLSNAVKYSPAGGEITVTLQETADEVTVAVTDEGVGVAKDRLPRLFQPFYRVLQPETMRVEGLGLGLALTRAIVEAHGGRIWAESEPGKGSKFAFALPKSAARDDSKS
jgi:signal transduction histidine kinase